MAKIKVNHNGSCNGYAFEAGKAIEVKEADVKEFLAALGKDAEVVEDKHDKDAEKEPAKEEKKEAKPDHNKMVGKGETVTK